MAIYSEICRACLALPGSDQQDVMRGAVRFDFDHTIEAAHLSTCQQCGAVTELIVLTAGTTIRVGLRASTGEIT